MRAHLSPHCHIAGRCPAKSACNIHTCAHERIHFELRSTRFEPTCLEKQLKLTYCHESFRTYVRISTKKAEYTHACWHKHVSVRISCAAIQPHPIASDRLFAHTCHFTHTSAHVLPRARIHMHMPPQARSNTRAQLRRTYSPPSQRSVQGPPVCV